MTTEGFITLHRKILTWEWFHDDNMFKLFIYLLLKANYEDSRYRGHEVNRGQLVLGLLQASTDTGIPKTTLHTCLKRLVSSGEISIKPNKKFSIITICKYDTYQSKKDSGALPPEHKRNMNGTQPEHKPDTTGTQPDTYKQDNNIINKPINNLTTAPAAGESEFFPFDEFWKMYDKNISEGECRKWWANNLPAADKERILRHLPQYVETTPDKKFRKDPLHYLISKAWLNEIIKPAAGNKEKSAIDLYIESENRISNIE